MSTFAAVVAIINSLILLATATMLALIVKNQRRIIDAQSVRLAALASRVELLERR